MKYVKQILTILAVTLLAEALAYGIPLPVPASIYGLLLMLGALLLGIIKLERVKETGNFLIEIMPIMFIPAAVGLLESYTELKGVLLPIAVIIVLTTVTVMAVTGRAAQRMMR